MKQRNMEKRLNFSSSFTLKSTEPLTELHPPPSLFPLTRRRPAGLPNQRPDLLLQEDGGALPGGGAQQHGVRPAGGQRATQASHHPECRHIPR